MSKLALRQACARRASLRKRRLLDWSEDGHARPLASGRPKRWPTGGPNPRHTASRASARYEALFVVMSKPPGVPTAPVAEVAPVPNERAMLWNPRVTWTEAPPEVFCNW